MWQKTREGNQHTGNDKKDEEDEEINGKVGVRE